MAALYVYTVRSPNLATINAGSRLLGHLQSGYWLRVDLPAGPTDILCSMPAYGTVVSEPIDLSADTVVYVSVTEKFSTWGCNLAVQPPATAQPAILAGKRARELR